MDFIRNIITSIQANTGTAQSEWEVDQETAIWLPIPSPHSLVPLNKTKCGAHWKCPVCSTITVLLKVG